MPPLAPTPSIHTSHSARSGSWSSAIGCLLSDSADVDCRVGVDEGRAQPHDCLSHICSLNRGEKIRRLNSPESDRVWDVELEACLQFRCVHICIQSFHLHNFLSHLSCCLFSGREENTNVKENAYDLNIIFIFILFFLPDLDKILAKQASVLWVTAPEPYHVSFILMSSWTNHLLIFFYPLNMLFKLIGKCKAWWPTCFVFSPLLMKANSASFQAPSSLRIHISH